MDRPDGQWGKFSFERQEAVFQWFVLTRDEARFPQAGAFQRPMQAALFVVSPTRAPPRCLPVPVRTTWLCAFQEQVVI